MRRMLMAAVATLLTAPLLVGCSVFGDRAEPGEIITTSGDVAGTKTHVNLPVGRLDLRITERLDDVDGRVGSAQGAPRGGGFVGIGWEMESFSLKTLAHADVLGTPRQATFTLVAGEHRYSLKSPYALAGTRGIVPSRRPGNFYVAIDGKPKTLRLEVTYDGVTQSLDAATGKRTTGRAAGLYDGTLASARHEACEPVTASGPYPRLEHRDATCDAAAFLVPYVADLGWASEGRRWVVADVTTNLPGPVEWAQSPNDRISLYNVYRSDPSVTLGGRKPDLTTTLGSIQSELLRSDRYVWQVRPDDTMPLHVRRTFEARPHDAGSPPRATIRLDRTLTLRF